MNEYNCFVCGWCGKHYYGDEIPKTCPVCTFPFDNFTIKSYAEIGQELETNNPNKKIEEYNKYFQKHSAYRKYAPIVQLFSWVLHIIMSIFSLIYICKTTEWKAFDSLSRLDFFNNISSFLPFYNNNIVVIIIFSLLGIFVVPLLINGLVISFFNKTIVNKATASTINDNCLNAYLEIEKKYPYSEFVATGIMFAIEIAIGIAIGFLGKGILVILIPVVMAVIGFFYASLSAMGAGNYVKTNENFKKLKPMVETYQKECDEYKKWTDEISKKAKQEYERRLKRERLANESELKFQTIKDVDNSEIYIKQLAKQGSISACLYICRKLYLKYSNEVLTNGEKKDLAEEIIEYLENISVSKNIEAEFLLLSIRIKSENNNLEILQQYLNQAREIKNSEKLPSEYTSDIEELINSLVETINDMEDRKTSFTIDYASLQARTNETLRNMYGGAAIVGSESNSDKIWDDIDGMKITNDNIDKINDPKYDVAGFPDSSDIW